MLNLRDYFTFFIFWHKFNRSKIWVLTSWGDNCWMKTLCISDYTTFLRNEMNFTEIAFFLFQPDSFDVFCYVYVYPAEPVPNVIGLLSLWLFLLMTTCLLKIGKSAKLAARFAFICIGRAFNKDYASPVCEGLCSGLDTLQWKPPFRCLCKCCVF